MALVHNGGMWSARFRLIVWATLVSYVAYLLAVAGFGHLVTQYTLSIAVTQHVWYSLASAAVAIGCWIALGDGNAVVRFVVGTWGLVCVWIVWQASIYLYAIREPGVPGSATEGFSVYAAGNAVIALAVSVVLAGLIRLTIGLRLVCDQGPLIPIRRHFTLAEALGVVAVCAVTIGGVRAVAPQDMSYFVWFTMPKEVLNFFWGWTYTTIIAVPTALLLVYPRRYLWALGYFLLTTTAIVVQQHRSLRSIPFSAWQFYWLIQVLGMLQVVAHIAVLQLVLRSHGYRLAWRFSRPAPLRQAAAEGD